MNFELKNYNMFHKCWASKFWCIYVTRHKEGSIDQVKCTISISMSVKDMFMVTEFDHLNKYEGKRKVMKNLYKIRVKVGEWYINKSCVHLKNVLIFHSES
jgi:hypothetical protein